MTIVKENYIKQKTPRITLKLAEELIEHNVTSYMGEREIVLYETNGAIKFINKHLWNNNPTNYIKCTWFIVFNNNVLSSYGSRKDIIKNIQTSINTMLEKRFKIENLEELTQGEFKKLVVDTTNGWDKLSPQQRRNGFNDCFYNYFKTIAENLIVVDNYVINFETHNINEVIHVRLTIENSYPVYELKVFFSETDKAQYKVIQSIVKDKMKKHKNGKKIIKDNIDFLK